MTTHLGREFYVFTLEQSEMFLHSMCTPMTVLKMVSSVSLNTHNKSEVRSYLDTH